MGTGQKTDVKTVAIRHQTREPECVKQSPFCLHKLNRRAFMVGKIKEEIRINDALRQTCPIHMFSYSVKVPKLISG